MSRDHAIAAITRPPETSTMGREIPKKRSMVAPAKSMATRNRTVLIAMRRAREW